MKQSSNRRRGQTLLLFVFATLSLFGMLGLVIDLGWKYFRKQAAQAAAQAAAAAAVAAAVESGGTTVSCTSINVTCQSETPCPYPAPSELTSNISKGCVYATTNGFSTTGRQKVTLTSGTG